MRKQFQIAKAAASLVAFFFFLLPLSLPAYSVLTHQAIIDASWDMQIRPLLRARFPNATPDEMKEAHAYAYGGAIIQDMGYYPHGSKFFSDLVHYVRSGDFVEALLRDSSTLDEYAFSLGALAHYAADNDGHKLGVNLSVPLLYPRLKKRYGDMVTYEDSPLAHIKTEFGFDVLEVAKHRYAPQSYHDFVGFEVAQPLLERAFLETYGIELKSLFNDEDRALGSYRHAVSSLIPKATRVAWYLKRKDIQKDLPGETKRQFIYNLSRATYEKEWGKKYDRPTFGEKFFAALYFLLPKIGPLKVLQFRTPTPASEMLLENSFNVTVMQYNDYLGEVKNPHMQLENDNIDVGDDTARGKYHLNDDTRRRLLNLLAQNDFATTPPQLKTDLVAFYKDPASNTQTKLKAKEEAAFETHLAKLRSSALSTASSDAPSH